MRTGTTLPLLLLLTACAMSEARSLDGRYLYRQNLEPEVLADREFKLQNAKTWLGFDQRDSRSIIWHGRRLAYLGRYKDAVKAFTRGIKSHPHNPRLYRHRGHRYITLRKLDLARLDLERARQLIFGEKDELEADGLPNKRNIPTSTLHFNIWYHLGLVHYLEGNFLRARWCYRECLATAQNNDAKCAAMHWLYMTLRRLGDEAGAQAVVASLGTDIEVIENHAYRKLTLMYRGRLSAEDLQAPDAQASSKTIQGSTLDYGLAAWHLYNGRKRQARKLLKQIVADGQWPAFGHIAAEADLANSALWE